MKGLFRFLAYAQIFLGVIALSFTLVLVFEKELDRAGYFHIGGGSGALWLLFPLGLIWLFYIILAAITPWAVLVYVRKSKKTGGSGGTGPV